MKFKISIDKEIVNKMPPVCYDGDIHVIETLPRIEPALRVLRQAPLVGFDTETRPAFHRGERHKVALIQIATHNECFLFRVNKTKMPQRLVDYLCDENYKKVGLSLHDDFNSMMRMKANLKPGGFIDIQDLVDKYGIDELGLQKIFAILFNQRISKAQRLTNWEAPDFTEAQKQYAAIDAWACLKIYEYLKSGNFRPEMSPYLTPVEDPDEQNHSL